VTPRENAEREMMKRDLHMIVRELQEAAQELHGAIGIGAEYCSSKLARLSEKFRRICDQL